VVIENPEVFGPHQMMSSAQKKLMMEWPNNYFLSRAGG
jgi:hypothetical protein